VRNRFLDSRTARDIDLQVAKILRGLGNPEPPIVLADVFDLLKLDRQYYSTQDDSALREFFSKAVIAGKQIARRPMLLLDAVKKWDLKALYVPDRKRVLIDQSQPPLKWRWNEAHEAIHSVTEWHQTLLHGDNAFSLSPDCHEQLEAEANFGAGRLLFLQDQFVEFSRSSSPTFSLVQCASKKFGNTITSSLWRLVEALDIPALGIVSQHPHYTEILTLQTHADISFGRGCLKSNTRGLRNATLSRSFGATVPGVSVVRSLPKRSSFVMTDKRSTCFCSRLSTMATNS